MALGIQFESCNFDNFNADIDGWPAVLDKTPADTSGTDCTIPNRLFYQRNVTRFQQTKRYLPQIFFKLDSMIDIKCKVHGKLIGIYTCIQVHYI